MAATEINRAQQQPHRNEQAALDVVLTKGSNGVLKRIVANALFSKSFVLTLFIPNNMFVHSCVAMRLPRLLGLRLVV